MSKPKFTSNLTGEELTQLYDQGYSGRAKVVKLDAKLFSKLVMDHSQLVSKLNSLGVDIE